MSTLVYSLLGLFTILSILAQIPKLHTFLARIDFTKLLPNYSFFAPKPMTCDYRLVFKLSNEKDSNNWDEIPICGNSIIQRLFFNPEKYYVKAFIDSCHYLFKEFVALDEDKKQYIQFSLNYINIFKIVMTELQKHEVRQSHTTKVQFAIVSSNNEGVLKIEELKFLSLIHKY